MADRFLEFSHSPLGRQLSSLIGLPAPPRLRRADGAYAVRPLAGRSVLVGGLADASLSGTLVPALAALGAELQVATDHAGLAPIKTAAAAVQLALKGESNDSSVHALVFDASGIEGPQGLRQLYDFMQPRVKRLASSGRVLLLCREPRTAGSPQAMATVHALRGFMRSLGKEIGRKGATANLVELEPGAEPALEGTLRFLLTEHSAFVSGQVLTLQAADASQMASDVVLPLRGKRALVTGAARGIGAAIAQVLAREGASVIGMDRQAEQDALQQTMAACGGESLLLDVTVPDAAERIADFAAGGLDVVVHNAGVLRDKTLRNMPPHGWDTVLAVNFGAILGVTDGLLKRGLNPGARVVCISSLNGIAGAAGQTNYAATKSGLIGYAEAMAPVFAEHGGAINAIAPGFIETQMTASIPPFQREMGRRLSSLVQGGLPVDVAEAATFLASPLAAGLNGRTLRVCGQNFVGA